MLHLEFERSVLKSLSLPKELMALWRHSVLICRWRVIWLFGINPESILVPAVFPDTFSTFDERPTLDASIGCFAPKEN